MDRSIEQNWESSSKTIHLWSTIFQQRHQDCSMVKEEPFQQLVLRQLNNQIQKSDVGGMNVMNYANKWNLKCLRNPTWSGSTINIFYILLDLFYNILFHIFFFYSHKYDRPNNLPFSCCLCLALQPIYPHKMSKVCFFSRASLIYQFPPNFLLYFWVLFYIFEAM